MLLQVGRGQREELIPPPPHPPSPVHTDRGPVLGHHSAGGTLEDDRPGQVHSSIACQQSASARIAARLMPQWLLP